MKRKNRIALLFTIFLCVFGIMTACRKNQTVPPTDSNSSTSESSWEDENVDINGWT